MVNTVQGYNMREYGSCTGVQYRPPKFGVDDLVADNILRFLFSLARNPEKKVIAGTGGSPSNTEIGKRAKPTPQKYRREDKETENKVLFRVTQHISQTADEVHS